MRFISLSQPWLWAITDLVVPADRVGALEPKRVENRTWQPPMSMIGQQIALHAAKSWDDDAVGFFLRMGIDWFPARKELYATSAIVAVATIDRIVTTPSRLVELQRPWYMGPTNADGADVFGWVLADVVKLATPVTMKGAQGLRGLKPETELQVTRQLGAAA